MLLHTRPQTWQVLGNAFGCLHATSVLKLNSLCVCACRCSGDTVQILSCTRNGKELNSREQMYATLVQYLVVAIHPKIHVGRWTRQGVGGKA